MNIRLAVCLMLVAMATPSAVAQRNARSETLVNCVTEFEPAPPLNNFGFAKAVLQSLWYARTAVEQAVAEIDAGKRSTDPFESLAASMRGTKLSTNQFICAKRTMKRFASPNAQFPTVPAKQRDTIRTAAAAAVKMYEAHIAINDRLLAVLNNLGQTDAVKLTDTFSSIDVERGQRWSDLVPLTGLSSMLLIDMRSTDENGNFITATEEHPGETRRLTITKGQKKELLDWMDAHFTEFRDGTPESQWSDPAKTARLFLQVFQGRKCSDE